MKKFKIIIDVEQGIEEDMIEWRVEEDTFPASTIELIGALERVKYYINSGDYDYYEEGVDDEEE